MARFTAEIEIIGINPFVSLPEAVLKGLFAQAGRSKGPIPLRLAVAGVEFPQTLVKYAGQWRLYLNGPMLKVAKKGVGHRIRIQLEFDPQERSIPMRPEFRTALDENPDAKAVFDGLSPSMRKEIVRYLGFLKSETATARNVERAIDFLLGKARFIGRERP
jgi:hypothetical protein